MAARRHLKATSLPPATCFTVSQRSYLSPAVVIIYHCRMACFAPLTCGTDKLTILYGRYVCVCDVYIRAQKVLQFEWIYGIRSSTVCRTCTSIAHLCICTFDFFLPMVQYGFKVKGQVVMAAVAYWLGSLSLGVGSNWPPDLSLHLQPWMKCH